MHILEAYNLLKIMIEGVFMKKIVAILTLISLLLFGCTSTVPAPTLAQSESDVTIQPYHEDDKNLFEQIADGMGELFSGEKKAVSEMGHGVRAESSFVLYITINPEFEVFLDSDACISKVRCINEDAQTLFADLDVLGKSYDEGLPLILDAACDQGYLNEQNSEITIETTVLEPLPKEYLESALPEVAAVFKEVVEQYATDNNLSITVELPEPEYDGPKVSVEDLGGEVGKPNSEKTYNLYDENDNVIGSNTEYFDENGILFKRVSNWDDGKVMVTEYAPNGVETYRTEDGPNGHFETHYDENGNVIRYVSHLHDGSKSETTYYPSGNNSNSEDWVSKVESTIQHNADGSYYEVYYREDGTEISSYSKSADGATIENSTNEDGSRVQIRDDAEGHFEWHFFADGTMSKYIEQSGSANIERTYYPSGQIATDIGTRNDGFMERHWDENGTLTYEHAKDSSREYLFENRTLAYYIENGVEITDENFLNNFLIAGGFYNYN